MAISRNTGNVRIDVNIRGKESASQTTAKASASLKTFEDQARRTTAGLRGGFGGALGAAVDILREKLDGVKLPNFALAAGKGAAFLGILGGLTAGLIRSGEAAARLESRMIGAFGSVSEAERALARVNNAVSLPALSQGVATLRQAGAEVELTSRQLAALGGAATAVGKSSDEAFTILAEAIARGEAASLNSVGLFVNGEAVMRDYAKTIGKTADELSLFDRQAATVRAALEGLNRTTAATSSNLDSIERFNNVLGSLFTSLQVGVLAPLAGAVADVLTLFFAEGTSGALTISRTFDQAALAVDGYSVAVDKASATTAKLPVEIARLRAEVAKLQGETSAGLAVLETASSLAEVDAAIAETSAALRTQERLIEDFRGAVGNVRGLLEAEEAKLPETRKRFLEINAEIATAKRVLDSLATGSRAAAIAAEHAGTQAKLLWQIRDLTAERVALEDDYMSILERRSDFEKQSEAHEAKLLEASDARRVIGEKLSLLEAKRSAIAGKTEESIANSVEKYKSTLGAIVGLHSKILGFLRQQDVAFVGMKNTIKLQRQIAADRFAITKAITLLEAAELRERLIGERGILELKKQELALVIASSKLATSISSGLSTAFAALGAKGGFVGAALSRAASSSSAATTQAETELASIETRLAAVAKGVEAADRLTDLSAKARFLPSKAIPGAKRVDDAAATRLAAANEEARRLLEERLSDLRVVIDEVKRSDVLDPFASFDRAQADEALSALVDYATKVAEVEDAEGRLIGISALLEVEGLNPITAALRSQIELWDAVSESVDRAASAIGEVSSIVSSFASGDEDFARLGAALSGLSGDLKTFAAASTDLGRLDAAILATGRFTAAMEEDTQKQALILGGMELVRAAVAVAAGRYEEALAHGAAAGIAFAYAGKSQSAAGGARGNAAIARPSAARAPVAEGGNVTVIVQGLLVGSTQELGARMHGILREARGTGFENTGAV